MNAPDAFREVDRNDFEKTIDDFEGSWNRKQVPKLADYENNVSRELLLELIVIDMEFRWKSWTPADDALGGKPRLEETLVAEPAVDIFGIGAILFSLITGRAPIASGRLDLPTRQDLECAGAKGGVAELCLRCLAPNPADRYSNAIQLLAEFDRLIR